MPPVHHLFSVDPHGRAIEGHLRVLQILALFVVLVVLGGCSSILGVPLTARSANQITGEPANADCAQCRLEMALAAATVIMTDNTVRNGSASEAGELAAKTEGIVKALHRARDADVAFQATESARALNELARLVASRTRKLVTALIGQGGRPTLDQIFSTMESASTFDAVVADIIAEMDRIATGERTLLDCQRAVDAQLATQVGRLEDASKPR